MTTTELLAKPRYSVVIPVSERRLNPDLLPQLTGAMDGLPHPYELIVVFDGHRAGEANRLRERIDNPRIHVIELHQDHGEGNTLRAGLDLAQGDYVLRLESEPQVDLKNLSLLAHYLESGSECVFLERVDVQGRPTGGFRRRLGNRVLSFLARTEVRDLSSLTCGFSREVARHVPTHGNLHRYLQVLVPIEGFATTYVQGPEQAGAPAKRHNLFTRFIDILAVFFLARGNQSPFRFFASIGAAPLLIGLFLVGQVVFERFAYQMPMASRPLLLLGLLLVSLGIQAFAIGFLGELMVFLHYRDRYPDHAQEL